MRHILFSILLFAISFPGTSFSTATSNELENLPPFVKNQIRYGAFEEDIIAQATRQFRDLSGNKNTLTKKDVELRKSIAEAAERARSVQRILMADLNGDGSVTQKEIEGYASRISPQNPEDTVKQFLSADLNQDKKITYQEMLDTKGDIRRYLGQTQEDIEALFLLDENKDGILTIDELKTSLTKGFRLLDANSDGMLSETEKQALNLTNDSSATSNPESVEKLKIDPDAELHVVGVYEGNSKTGEKLHGPTGKISLDRPGKKIALLLLSYEPVKWEITATKNTRISNVFLSSYGENAISEAWINGRKFEAAKTISAKSYAYEKSGDDFRQLLAYVKASMGRDRIDSFHGKYTAPGTPFHITSISVNFELKKDRLKATSEDELPKLIFRAKIRDKYGIYTLSGKLVKELPDSLNGAAYVDENTYYALGENSIQKLNAKGDVVKTIPVSLDVPVFSWATGIAYNQKIKQLAVSSFGGEGVLYHYDLKSQKWTAASLNNNDYVAFAYDPESGMYVSSNNFGPAALHYLDKNGKHIKKIMLEAKDFPGLFDFSDAQNGHPPSLEIIPKDSYFIILAKRGEHMPQASDSIARVYLYNPKTKEVKLTYFSD